MEIIKTATLEYNHRYKDMITQFEEDMHLPKNEYWVYQIYETDTGLILFNLQAWDLLEYTIDSELNIYDVAMDKTVNKR